VLSVGNLTLGGTGKTPLVETVAALLRDRGHRVAILSRGYGRRGHEPLTVVSDGEKVLVSPEVAGDEAFLLAEHLPGVSVLVGKDRYRAGALAVQRFGVQAVVLDDGFQYLPLARDLNLLLLDAARPLGSGRLFPRGDLREAPSAIARADAIVFTRWEPGMLVFLSALQLRHPWPALFCSQHEPIDLRLLQDGQALPLTSLKDRRVLAFCGIGAPESFRRLLHQLGATVVAFFAFPDHHVYERPGVEALARTAASHGAEAMVTTEKDGVRLRRLSPLPWPVWELRIRTPIVGQGAAWEACLLRALGEMR
jgi:tetraacyldisaccharide 4'-kinase